MNNRRSVRVVGVGNLAIASDVIHDAVVASKACEGLIHSTVVVFRYGGYTIRSSKVLEPPKRYNEGGEELTSVI